MPSFDIVSKVDLSEVDNALAGMKREIGQRFDFKGSKCSIERNEGLLTLLADDNLKLKQMHELLQGWLARRKIDVKALDYGEPQKASGNALRQEVTIQQGIGGDIARQIVKAIKDAKSKVQASIQADQVRVSGKSRDDLQSVITLLKGKEFGIELQFENYRST